MNNNLSSIEPDKLTEICTHVPTYINSCTERLYMGLYLFIVMAFLRKTILGLKINRNCIRRSFWNNSYIRNLSLWTTSMSAFQFKVTYDSTNLCFLPVEISWKQFSWICLARAGWNSSARCTGILSILNA